MITRSLTRPLAPCHITRNPISKNLRFSELVAKRSFSSYTVSNLGDRMKHLKKMSPYLFGLAFFTSIVYANDSSSLCSEKTMQESTKSHIPYWLELRRQAHYDEALAEIEREFLTTNDPDEKSTLLAAKGLIYHLLGDNKTALIHLNEAIAVLGDATVENENMKSALYEKTKVLAELGYPREALPILEALIDKTDDPLKKTRMITRCGRFLRFDQKPKEALEVLEKNYSTQKELSESGPLKSNPFILQEMHISLIEIIECHLLLADNNKALACALKAKELHSVMFHIKSDHPEKMRLNRLLEQIESNLKLNER